jgi:hypothetical protein
MGATSGAGTAYPSGASEFTPGSCYSIFSVMCMFCRSLFVVLYFFFWPLCCLFFFDIRILITPFGIFKFFLTIDNLQSIPCHFKGASFTQSESTPYILCSAEHWIFLFYNYVVKDQSTITITCLTYSNSVRDSFTGTRGRQPPLQGRQVWECQTTNHDTR